MTESNSGSLKMCQFELVTNSVEEAYGHIIKRLAVRYCLLYPEKSPSDFSEEILRPLANSTPDTPADIKLTYFVEQSKAAYNFAAKRMLDACALCVEALDADLDGRSSDAWRCVSNAMYELGVLEGTVILEPAVGHIIQANGSTGARNRDKKYEGARELARTLAMEGDYADRAKAARAIKDRVVAKAKADSVQMSQTRAERTIYDWLEGLAFRGKR
jgi:hypothetical protein